MSDYSRLFLLANLALSFYNVGAIWAHEVDIFRSWKLIEPKNFHVVQEAHWKKLPYWVLIPAGLALLGAIGLVGYHPLDSPEWAIWGNLACQLLALGLTIVFWGQWQAKLSRDSLGSESPFLDKILKTHWIRTALITLYAAILFVWMIHVLH